MTPASTDGLLQTLAFAARTGAVVVIDFGDGARPNRVRFVDGPYEFTLARDVDLSTVKS